MEKFVLCIGFPVATTNPLVLKSLQSIKSTLYILKVKRGINSSFIYTGYVSFRLLFHFSSLYWCNFYSTCKSHTHFPTPPPIPCQYSRRVTNKLILHARKIRYWSDAYRKPVKWLGAINLSKFFVDLFTKLMDKEMLDLHTTCCANVYWLHHFFFQSNLQKLVVRFYTRHIRTEPEFLQQW